jgi:hypothetical protein
MNVSLWTISPCISVTCINFTDVAKARMQLQGETGSVTRFTSTWHVISYTWKTEGLSGLQRGLSVSLLREASLNCIRLGMYQPIMDVIHPGYIDASNPGPLGAPSFKSLAFAGCISGALGSAFASPFELIKTRLQCAGPLATGFIHPYSTLRKAVAHIWQHEGPAGFWKGSPMFILRNIIGSGSNLGSFMWLKSKLLKDGANMDPILTDLISAGFSGIVTSVAMSPVDVVKTRYQNQPIDILGRNIWYTSPLQTLELLLRNEGFFALYKGFVSLFLRTGPHHLITFTTYGDDSDT